MTIAIKIVSSGQRPVDGPRAEFGPAGGTIGRRSDMTLVIPDKTRRVSRVHAVISHQNGQFRIRDQGSFLPVYVNGHGVGFQRDMTLHAGDRIQIGDFGFEVSHADGQSEATDSPDPGAEAFAATPDPVHSPSAPFLSTLKLDRSADLPRPVPTSVAPTHPARSAIEDGPATFALLEQRLTAQNRTAPWPDVSMYRDVPVENRAIPIPYDGAATQDLHTEDAADRRSSSVAAERRTGVPESDDSSGVPTPSDDAPPSEGGYVIPIRKRRRRA